MAADERLTALQRAYADIILNTAKEAAARIMMSEIKAQRSQRELQAAKCEGLRMLLRLKQMMDSKITEAESTSLIQQRKIEELEAQLQEAEDIVKDLREELREVQSELEWARSNRVQHPAEHQDVTVGEISEQNRYNSSESVVFHPPESEGKHAATADMRNTSHFQRNECHKFCRSISNMGNSYAGCPDLPSIILRSKEPELYRNGCTQRIRASEGNLLDKELSLSGKTTKKNDDISAREYGRATEIFHGSALGMENQRNFKKKIHGADGQRGNWKPIQSFSVKRKRANRYRSRFNSSRNVPDQILTPNVLCTETHPSPVRTDVNFDGDASQMAQRLSSDKSELGPQTSFAEVSQHQPEVSENRGNGSTVNEKLVTEKLVDTRQEAVCIEKSTVPVAETYSEQVNGLLPKLEANDVAHETPSEPISERIIKFTFQRKRKKESVSESNGSASLEKKISKRHTVDKENDASEQEKSKLMTESSRDSRRLAQVARQLISLSEKKWWQ